VGTGAFPDGNSGSLFETTYGNAVTLVTLRIRIIIVIIFMG
jgi:hypothetical protein